jgi:hypothetical protein
MRGSLKWLCLWALVFASACGYDGHYRYSCQDPENWESEECNPPSCKVDGNCTEYLLGFDPSQETVETIPVEETIAP